MNLPAYPRYKASGVAWLGDVPEGWEVKRLKFAARLDEEKAEVDPDNPLPYIGLEHIESWTGKLKQLDEEFQPTGIANRFKAGQLLFGKLRPYLAKATLPTFPGLCSSELLPLQTTKHNTQFLLYLLLSRDFIDIVDSSTYGSKMPRASWDFIGDCSVSLPPLPEQAAIATFLDSETAKIDALTEKQHRMLDLLKEKRTATISHAVTKGLNPNAKLKDSGVALLGQVPERWEVKRLRHLLSTPLQYGANEAAEYDIPEWPRYIRITDVTENGELRPETFRSLPEEVAEKYLLSYGDVLFARSGATVGKTFLYKNSWGTCAYAGYLIRAKIFLSRALPEFIKYFTESTCYWQWVASVQIQATIQNISAEKYGDMPLPLPTLPEQAAIAAYLDRETAKIDTLAARIKDMIAKLQEYRTALITAAVTGKVDVR